MEDATLICCRLVWVPSPSPHQLISANDSPLPSLLIFFFFGGGINFLIFFILYSALLHLAPLRFPCADGCWDRTQDRCNWCIGRSHPLLGQISSAKARSHPHLLILFSLQSWHLFAGRRAGRDLNHVRQHICVVFFPFIVLEKEVSTVRMAGSQFDYVDTSNSKGLAFSVATYCMYCTV